MELRTLPFPPTAEKVEQPGIFTADTANLIRDALARSIVARPRQVAEALYLLGLDQEDVFDLCDALLALDERWAA